ncbi:MAG TPA: SPOR domain-containing protein [Candidatus Krumholzibacteria bacterium]|nr:SPOR domain-containing protein [Candidatus Krumholzibacteria bacterium]
MFRSMRYQWVRYFAAAALLVWMAACGATSPPKQSTGRVEPAPQGTYDFRSEGKIPPPAGGAAQPEADVEEMAVSDSSVEGTDVEAPPDTLAKAPATADSVVTVDGFRIQVFASADRDVAQNARAVAAERLGVPAYLDLEGGVYKVRVGDYVKRGDADAVLPTVRSHYYPDAWIVPAKVNVPRGR